MKFDQQSTEIILRNFEMEAPGEPLSEEEIFELLSNRIAYMIEHKIDFLLSLLYRMDVLEHKINFALSPNCPEPANIALAKLVMERQRARISTKENIDVSDIEGLEDELKW
ncbi:MAG: hypothetical protein GYB31_03135 [Bacteroidetes bacterium]|nr:hypothetical protein [Bacteroidota bacterium]